MSESTEFALEFYPITPERWPDFESLFGEKGGYAGCWCMFWRLERAQFKSQKYEGNKDTARHLVYCGETLGLLGYADGHVAAWCSIGPRECYKALEKSRILKRVDEQAVWSIVCFHVAKPFRRQGMMRPMLQAALAYAKSNGASIVEGYPIDLRVEFETPGGYMGIASAFLDVGFVEVGRVSDTQLIMRYHIPD
ncbi:hypothetical protein ARNL5_03605 [Anaerolineae bacterium]|nr:hypothetical protein ARNL5_03605 [Anaerolineae bacterium]